MIIEICSSIEDDLNDNKNIDALEKIAQSRKSGNCIILSKKTTIRKIIATEGLSSRHKSIFIKIENDQTKWFNFLRDFTPALRIVKKGTENTSPSSPLEICLEDFYYDEGNVIAENINDIDFLREIIDSTYKKRGVNGLVVKFRGHNGGGSTTHQVIDDFQKNRVGETAFCLLDSDKDLFCDEDFLGGTATKSLSKISGNAIKLYTLKCREIENIIPFKTIEYLFEGNHPLLRKLDSIKSLSSVTIREKPALEFFDMKHGIKGFELRNHVNNINGEIENLDKILNCGCTSKRHCQCKIIDGLGSDLLPNIIRIISNHEISFYDYENYKSNEIDSIVQMASSFVLSFERLTAH